MAKKRAQPNGKPVSKRVDSSDLKPIRLMLTPQIQTDFRVAVARHGMSMAAMAKKLVEDWTKREKEASGK